MSPFLRGGSFTVQAIRTPTTMPEKYVLRHYLPQRHGMMAIFTYLARSDVTWNSDNEVGNPPVEVSDENEDEGQAVAEVDSEREDAESDPASTCHEHISNDTGAEREARCRTENKKIFTHHNLVENRGNK